MLGGSSLDFSQGQTTATGNPLDLALEGDGFFALQTPRGVRYTREGGLTRSSTGVLQDGQGEPVLDTLQQPIVIPTGDVSVAANGTVSVATAAGSTIVGQVGVFSFTDKSVLSAEGTNRFSVSAGTLPVAGTATIRQGAIEGSNEDAVQGTMQLVLVQRQAEMMQKALSVFYQDLDKTAAEELGKV